MGLKVTNNAFGTLNASINSSATTIVLVAGQGARFPTLSAGDYFYATLIDTSNNLEIVKCTARSTDTLTVVRAQDNTTARAYATNDRFELRPTAVLLTEVITAAEGALPKAGGTMTGPLVLQGGDGSVQRSGGNTWIILSSNTGYNSNGVHLKLDNSTAAGAFHFFSVGTSILEMAGAGNTLVLQGGSTSAGTGIAFPATQSASSNANTLDDYEEGTWTPNLGGNTTYSAQTANYTKIGRTVFCWFDFTVNAIGTGSPNTIAGLPFTGGAITQGQPGSVAYWSSAANAVTALHLRVDIGSTSISMASTTGNQNTVTNAPTFFGNGARLLGSVSYNV